MIQRDALPENALLQTYAESGAYTDCYVTTVRGSHEFDAYVVAFYMTWLFKLERVILALLAKRPSTDLHALELAEGRRDDFAAWRVEARADNQLLMCDFRDRTRSWFMVEPIQEAGLTATRLYFGSAVVPLDQSNGSGKLGFAVSALMGFHKLYSRALLSVARARLRRSTSHS